MKTPLRFEYEIDFTPLDIVLTDSISKPVGAMTLWICYDSLLREMVGVWRPAGASGPTPEEICKAIANWEKRDPCAGSST